MSSVDSPFAFGVGAVDGLLKESNDPCHLMSCILIPVHE